MRHVLRSTHDLEEMFWGMLLPGEFAREHLKAVVNSIDPGGTGKVGLRELVTFVRARQGGGAGNARKNAETALRRWAYRLAWRGVWLGLELWEMLSALV